MILLDTHVWVWWIGGESVPTISKKARQVIESSDTLLVSMASSLEVAWLEANSRLKFNRDSLTWINQALSKSPVKPVEITTEIIVRAANLPWKHKDPNDRLIVATALIKRVPLVTKDEVIRRAKLVETIW